MISKKHLTLFGRRPIQTWKSEEISTVEKSLLQHEMYGEIININDTIFLHTKGVCQGWISSFVQLQHKWAGHIVYK